MMKKICKGGSAVDGFWLKLLAMVTMLIDHTGMALFPQMPELRLVGRLAFPVYCFLLAEGAAHTSNFGNYLGRLAAFAVISEVPYDLACRNTLFYVGAQNVFFTLFLGLAACGLLQRYVEQKPLFSLAGVAGLALLAEALQTDYGAFGVALVAAFFVCRVFPLRGTGIFAVLNTGFSLLNNMSLQLAAPVAAVPILLYNGRRGRRVNRYLFYGFYPAHLLLLYFVRLWMI